MKTTLPTRVAWPLRALPVPTVSGNHPLADRDYAVSYRIPLLAIHLYDYAADMRLDNGLQFALRPGDLTLTPAGVEARYHLPRPGRHWCVHIAMPATDGPLLDLPLHHRLGTAATMARERFVRVSEHHRRARGAGPDHPGLYAAGAGLLELLCWLADQDGPGQAVPPGERAVTRAAELLRAQPARDWRGGELARAVGLSPGYLARRFRRRYGHTLARYQLIQRIGAAQALLACTGRPVGDIGREVGVPDPHHFNKLFRQVAGLAPTAFRAGHRM